MGAASIRVINLRPLDFTFSMIVNVNLAAVGYMIIVIVATYAQQV